MEAVPVAGLTENFSPRSLMAPPPLGAETVGRRSAARAGLPASAEPASAEPARAAGTAAALSGDPAGGLARSAEPPCGPRTPAVLCVSRSGSHVFTLELAETGEAILTGRDVTAEYLPATSWRHGRDDPGDGSVVRTGTTLRNGRGQLRGRTAKRLACAACTPKPAASTPRPIDIDLAPLRASVE